MSFYCIITPDGWVREGLEIIRYPTLQEAVEAKIREPNHIIPMANEEVLQEFVMGHRHIPTFNKANAR